MRDFAKIKKNDNLSFGNITYDFPFYFTLLLPQHIYTLPQSNVFLLIVALKRAVTLGWEEQLDELKLIRSWC